MRQKRVSKNIFLVGMIWLAGVGIILTPGTACARLSYPIKGIIDLTAQTADVSLTIDSSSSVQLLGKKQSKKYAVSLKFDHIQTPRFNLSTSLELILDGNKPEFWKGKWWTRYSLVDFQPIRELSGEFVIKEKEVTFSNTVIGPLALQGEFEKQKPYRFNIDVLSKAMDLETLMKWWLKSKKNHFGGALSGKLVISGDIENILLKGDFIVEDVTYQEHAYQRIELSLGGRYPNVVISNCLVTTPEGYQVGLSGPFDLSDQENYKNQILALSRKLSIEGSDSGLKWKLNDGDDPSSTTEIKYMRRHNELFGQDNTDDENFIGLERSLEF